MQGSSPCTCSVRERSARCPRLDFCPSSRKVQRDLSRSTGGQALGTPPRTDLSPKPLSGPSIFYSLKKKDLFLRKASSQAALAPGFADPGFLAGWATPPGFPPALGSHPRTATAVSYPQCCLLCPDFPTMLSATAKTALPPGMLSVLEIGLPARLRPSSDSSRLPV